MGGDTDFDAEFETGKPIEEPTVEYGRTTRGRLGYLACNGLTGYQLNQVDLGRLWELVQAAEGLDTVTNPVHSRQRLRKALSALREDNRLAVLKQGR